MKVHTKRNKCYKHKIPSQLKSRRRPRRHKHTGKGGSEGRGGRAIQKEKEGIGMDRRRRDWTAAATAVRGGGGLVVWMSAGSATFLTICPLSTVVWGNQRCPSIVHRDLENRIKYFLLFSSFFFWNKVVYMKFYFILFYFDEILVWDALSHLLFIFFPHIYKPLTQIHIFIFF